MMQKESVLESLYTKYQNDTGIRYLIEAISLTGLPLNSLIETFVGTYVNKMVASRLRTFYEELNNGEVELTDEIIQKEDFLHSYFSVVNYVARSKNDEKSKRFAKIIKGLYRGDLDANEFEDYTSIFDELSEREFIILCIKSEFEKLVVHDSPIFANHDTLDPYPKTNSYWAEFTKEIKKTLDIDKDILSSILIRLQRTGCYKIHFGQYEGEDGIGDTTVIFKKLYEIVKD